MSEEKEHASEIRRRAHQLAAEGIRAGLNMWDLDTYYASQADQDALELELLAIARRLEKRGGAVSAASSRPAAGARQDEPDHVCNSVQARGHMDEPLGYLICGECGTRKSGPQ